MGSRLSSSRQSTRASSPPSGNTHSLCMPITHVHNAMQFPIIQLPGTRTSKSPSSLPTGLHLSSLPPSQIVTTLVILGGARELGLVDFPAPSKYQIIKVLICLCVRVCVCMTPHVYRCFHCQCFMYCLWCWDWDPHRSSSEWLATVDVCWNNNVAYISQSTHVHCVEEIYSPLHFHWSSLHPQVSGHL